MNTEGDVGLELQIRSAADPPPLGRPSGRKPSPRRRLRRRTSAAPRCPRVPFDGAQAVRPPEASEDGIEVRHRGVPGPDHEGGE